uniref:PAS domain-containing protein n=1 Tax=Syphacia muris TaxID=451379 RepID=A0A0N5AG91_9BILA
MRKSYQLLSPLRNAQSQLQGSFYGKRRLKAVIIVDAETTEILVGNDNLKHVLGPMNSSIIGRRLSEIFSTNKQSPTVYYNLFTVDGHLKNVYGKVVSFSGYRLTATVTEAKNTLAQAKLSLFSRAYFLETYFR